MMVQRFFAVAALAVLMGVAAAAQDIAVTYAEGPVQVQSGSAWKNVNIGDKLPAQGTVRLGAQASLEVQTAGVTILFSRPGTYELQKAVAARRTGSSGTVLGALQNNLSKTVGGAKSPSQASVAGVRAENKAAASVSQWMASDAAVGIATATSLLADGKAEAALASLAEAEALATDEELPQVLYLGATAWAMQGEVRKALDLADRVQAPADAEWRADFVLLKAQLLTQSFAWREAADLLAANEAGLGRDTNRGQLFNLLYGFALRNLGDAAKAKQKLNLAVELGKDTPLGQSAAALLAGN